jgi:hypothetical protein
VGQVKPVPALFDRVVAEPAVELLAEDSAGPGVAQFGQRLDVDGERQAGAEAGLGLGELAPGEQLAQPGLGGLDGGLAQPPALEQVQVLL